jgi:hypothetical protein
LVLVMAAFVPLVGAGCGDDGDSGGSVSISAEEKPYVDALAKNLRAAGEGSDDIPLSDAQSDCLAPRWVDTIGVERFEKAGVKPADIASDEKQMDFEGIKFTDAEATKMYDAFGSCDVNLRELLMKSMTEGEDVSPAARKCMEGVLTDDAIRKLMILGLTEGDKAMSDGEDLPPELAGIVGCAFMSMGDGSGDSGSGSGSDGSSGDSGN